MSTTNQNSASNTNEWLLDVVDSTHTCRICYEEFNDTDKVARILSCGHTFCTECLQNLIRVSDQMFPTCPECRKMTFELVNTLPVNFQFMQMLRKMLLTKECLERDKNRAPELTPPSRSVRQRPGNIENMINSLQLLVLTISDQLVADLSLITQIAEKTHMKNCVNKIDEITRLINSLNEDYNTAQRIRESYGYQGQMFDDFDDNELDGSSITSGYSDFLIRGNPRLSEILPQNTRGPELILSTVFYTDFNQNGQNVLRCQTCNCLLPFGCQQSHLNGRRHQTNVQRRLNGEPIIESNLWRERFSRRRSHFS